MDKLFTYYKNINDGANTQVDFDFIKDLLKNSLVEETKTGRQLYKTDEKAYREYKSGHLGGITFNCSIAKNKIHSKNNIVDMTGYLQLDYDKLKNVNELKTILTQHPSVALIFTSASGSGLKVIVRIGKIKSSFYDYFHAVDEVFTKYILKFLGTTIESDKSCSNENRLCFMCNDENFYYNPNPKALIVSIKKKPIEKVSKEAQVKQKDIPTSDILEKIVKAVGDAKIDLTEDYADWVRIGFIIRNTIPDYNSGLNYFLLLSRFHPNYDLKKATEKYKSLFSSQDTGIKAFIPSLIMMCKAKGIDLYLTKEELKAVQNFKVKMSDVKKIFIDEGFSIIFCVIKQKRILKHGKLFYLIDDSGNKVYNMMRCWFLDKYDLDLQFRDLDMFFDNIPRKEVNFVKDILIECINDGTDEIDKVMENFIVPHQHGVPYEKIEFDKYEKLMRFFMGCIHNWTKDTYERKYDEILIFRSEVSIGKTDLINNFLFSIFKSFHGIYYLSESTNFYENNKDHVYQDHTSLINYKPEISDTIGKKADAIKSYISKKTFTQRRPYSRTEETFNSYACFLGDTNNTYFLPDDINNRRFIVLELTKLTFLELDETSGKYENKNIDWRKFWGQLYYKYKQGITYHDFHKPTHSENEQFVSTDRDFSIFQKVIKPGREGELIHIDSIIPTMEDLGLKITDTKKNSIQKHLRRLGYSPISKYDADIKNTKRGYYNIQIDNNYPIYEKTINLKDDNMDYLFNNEKKRYN